METNTRKRRESDLKSPLIELSDLTVQNCSVIFQKNIDGFSIDLCNEKDNNLLQIQNRRYLGNKHKLCGLIEEIVMQECAGYESFCDIFAGTGVVGHFFNDKETKIISNELLYSNYISLYAWLSSEPFDRKKIEDIISKLNAIKADRDNYVSENYGNKYFSVDNARKIGEIRETIEKIPLNFKEKCILLTTLLYAVDKVANTCGHYDAFRKHMDTFKQIKLLMPDINQDLNKTNEVFNEDANALVKNSKVDILYIDPPYNSRQYCDTYHLLENLARWTKPTVFGKAGKMNRTGLKSRYCLKGAAKAFDDLVRNANCKHILVSYNNTGKSKNGRSNARISDDTIVSILKNKGKLAVFEKDYKAFTTGKSEVDGHTERIFYCKVTN